TSTRPASPPSHNNPKQARKPEQLLLIGALGEAFELEDRAFDDRTADVAALDELERGADAGRRPAVDRRLAQRLRGQASGKLESIGAPADALRQQIHDELAPFEFHPRRRSGQLIERDHVLALGANAGAG